MFSPDLFRIRCDSFLRALRAIPRPVFIGWAIFLIVLAVYWVQLHRSHQDQLQHVEERTKLRAAQTVHALALQAGTLIETIDYASQALADGWLSGSEASYRHAFQVAQEALPQGALVQAAIADHHGRILFSSLEQGAVVPGAPPVSIADREHFQVHLAGGTPRLFISKPVLGRISRQWTVQFSRPLLSGDAVVGVQVLSVSVEYLSRAFRQIFPDPDDVAMMLSDDGAYLARSHLLDAVLGAAVPPTRLFVIDPVAQYGFYDVVAPVDGVERFYAWHRAANYPVVVSLGLSKASAMAAVVAAVRNSRNSNAAATLLLLLAAGWITRLVAQRNQRSFELLEAAQRLEMALRGGRLGIWNWNCETGENRVNERWVEMFGFRLDELAADFSTWNERVHPEDRDRVLAAVNACLRGETEQYVETYRMTRRDGSVVWVQDRGCVVAHRADGGASRMAGTLLDVTAIKHAEEVELIARERLAKLVAEVPGMVYQFLLRADGSACFPYTSPGVMDIYGISPDQAERSADEVFTRIHPADLERVTASITTSAEHLETWRCEYRVVARDGQVQWVFGQAKPERTEDGATLWHGYIHDITARVEQTQLRRALLEQSTAAIMLVDARRRVVFANTRMHEIFAFAGENLAGLDLARLHVSADHYQKLGAYYETLRVQHEVRFEYPLKDASGQVRWFDMQGVLRDPEDVGSDVVWTLIDVTERHEVDVVLAIERLRLTTLLERFPGGVLMEDANGVVAIANQTLCDLFGLDVRSAELQGLSHGALSEMLGTVGGSWLQTDDVSDDGEKRRTLEVDGANGRALEIDRVPIVRGDEPLGRVWLVRDVTRRKEREALLSSLAATDGLTGLPNRRSFMATLESALTDVSLEGGQRGVLLMLDLDHFKQVNDRYGHAVGDAVLQHAAQIIRHGLRENDFAGRIGGEEFTVLLQAVDEGDGLVLANRLRERLATVPAVTDAGRINLTVSIGLAVLDGSSSKRVLRHADEALYAAKAAGRNRVCSWPL